jgi:hypothetical protein
MALQIVAGRAVDGTPEYWQGLREFHRSLDTSNKSFLEAISHSVREGLKENWNRGKKVSLYVSKQDHEQIDRFVQETLQRYPKDKRKIAHALQLKDNLDHPESSDPSKPFAIQVQRLLGKSLVKDRLSTINHALNSYIRRWGKRDLLFMTAAIGFSVSPAAEPIAEHISLAMTTAGSLVVARLISNMTRLAESMKYYLREDFIDHSQSIVDQHEDHSMKHLAWGIKLSPSEVETYLRELMKPEDYERFQTWRDSNPAENLHLLFDYNVTRNEVGVPVIVSVLRVAKPE